jgi:hypothetical protein
VEVDRVVPASGNLWIGGQQIWLGPAVTLPLRVDGLTLAEAGRLVFIDLNQATCTLRPPR